MNKNLTEKRGKKNNDPEEEIPEWIRVENFLRNWYDLQYNEVSNEVEYKQVDEVEFKTLNENNLFRVLKRRNVKISMNNLLALLRSDFVPTINPFKEYFQGLPKWNENKTDYIYTLAGYVKAKDQIEFDHHFKKMLVRTVACALIDNYYNKHAFILVGPVQNTGKSTFIRFLCPPRLRNYISENISVHDKDSLISLSCNFIINIDELSGLNKVEINTLKSYFSKDQVKIRHPFDRKPISTPRRASFFGSTNKTEFLSDETGSVRWLCFEIENIDWDYSKKVNTDLVWSQAYSLFQGGKFKYELTREEIEENETRNKLYHNTTIEIDLIQKYYKPGDPADNDAFYTCSDFMKSLKEKIPGVNINIISIGKALRILGYDVSVKRKEKGYPEKGYFLKFL